MVRDNRRPQVGLEPIQTTSSSRLSSVTAINSNGADDARVIDLDEAEDASEWLNDALQGIGATSADGGATASDLAAPSRSAKQMLVLDSHLSKLYTSLSVARQDTLATIDSTMSAVTSTIPRLGLELRLMRDAARTLKQNIDQLRSEADAAGMKDVTPIREDGQQPSGAVAVLERLAALSALHSRMTAAQNVLSLAESWSTLSTDVNAYLADAKYDVAAARLIKAKSSLSVFERTPEFSSRKKLLDGLASAIESRLLPSLVDAIRDRDLGQAKRLLGVLHEIDRRTQMFDIWRRTRSEDCLTEWTKIADSITADSSAQFVAGRISSKIKRFADVVFALLNEERKIAAQIFSVSAFESVSELATHLLSALQPTLASQLALWIPQDNPNAILHACEIHAALRYMALGITNVSESADGGPQSDIASIQGLSSGISQGAVAASPESKSTSLGQTLAGGHTTVQQRRSSARRSSMGVNSKTSPADGQESVNDDGTAPAIPAFERLSRWEKILLAIPVAKDWEEKLVSPLVDVLLGYETMERSYIASVHVDGADTAAEPDVQLQMQIAQALRFAGDAASRTRKLTYGLACDALVSTLDDNLAASISTSKQAFDRQAGAELDGFQGRKGMGDAATGAAEPTARSGGPAHEGREWRSFESGMQLLAKLKASAEQVAQIEWMISEQIFDLAELLLSPVSTPSTLTDTLNRLCTEPDGTVTAPLRLLLEASKDRLRSGSLLVILKRIHANVTHAPARRKSTTSTASSLPPPRSGLFHSFRSALLNYVRAVHRHLTDMILAPLMPDLQTYAALPIWSAARLPGLVNDYDLNMPSFSLSPTEDMSRIGEALLDLPRLLEVWSDRKQFMWAVQGLAYAPTDVKTIYDEDGDATLATDVDLFSAQTGANASSPKRDKRISMHAAATNAAVTTTATSPNADKRALGSAGSHRHTPSVASIATLPARGEQSRTREEAALTNATTSGGAQTATPQVALQSYLTAICLTLVSHLVSLVLPSISQLTGPGASQLAADLEYLLTILSALNITPPAQDQTDRHVEGEAHKNDVMLLSRSLEAWKDVCKIKDQDGRRLRHHVRTGQVARSASLGDVSVPGFEDDQDRLRSLLGTQAFDMVARMRGW